MIRRKRQKMIRDNEQRQSFEDEESVKETKTVNVRSKPKVEKEKVVERKVERVVESTDFMRDNLAKLHEVDESKIPEICKAKAIYVTDFYSKKYADCKVATHVEIGHRGQQGYHDITNSHYETDRDYTLIFFDKDDMFFIEVVVILIPLKEPIELDKDDLKHLVK